MATFNPNDYIMKLQGKEYLPVQARLLWLRTMHPDAVLQTELLEFKNGEYALFKATITIPGRGSATGHGSEDPKGFRDYIEKAETKAIGRALGALGFGTQFTDDFDTPVTATNEVRVVDSPVERKTTVVRQEIQPSPQTTVVLGKADKPAEKPNTKERLRKQADRLGTKRLQDQSQIMFNVNSSSLLTPDQVEQLIAWAESQEN